MSKTSANIRIDLHIEGAILEITLDKFTSVYAVSPESLRAITDVLKNITDFTVPVVGDTIKFR